MNSNPRLSPGQVHIAHLSYDVDVFDSNAAQDSRQRQLDHAHHLETRSPGARTTFIVLSSRKDLRREEVGNLTFLPRTYYRIRHLPRLYSCLREINRECPISLLTTQDVQGLSWAALAFGRLSGIPVIGQDHCDLVSEESRKINLIDTYGRFYGWITLNLLRFYDGMRVVNTASKKYMLGLGFKNPIKVIPVSVTVPKVSSGEVTAEWRYENALRVLYVGRMIPFKNLERWLNAANSAMAGGENLEFVLIGDGPERERMQAKRDQLGLQDRVRFAGPMEPAQLASWYETADVLLLTSDYEAFGRVVVEAMFYRTVPVCTDVSGPRDIIAADNCGFLVNKDAQELAKCILTLAHDREKLRHMGERAREKAMREFAPERLRAEWIDFLVGFIRR